MVKRVCIIDYETTSLTRAENQQPIEVACALFDVEHVALLDCFSSLVRAPSNEAEDINHIPPAILADAREWQAVESAIMRAVLRADAVTSWNWAFDREWMPANYRGGPPAFCAMNDVEWPIAGSSKSLADACARHGVAVAGAHRALADVLAIERLLVRADELHRLGKAPLSLADMIARALRPKVRVVSLAPFEQKDAVKAAGFAWDSSARIWWRDMAQEDVGALSFRTRVEQPAPPAT